MQNDTCPVTRDLNHYLDDQDLYEAHEDAVELLADEIRASWAGSVTQWPDGHWYWAIQEGQDQIADEICETESEARQGLDSAMALLPAKIARKKLAEDSL